MQGRDSGQFVIRSDFTIMGIGILLWTTMNILTGCISPGVVDPSGSEISRFVQTSPEIVSTRNEPTNSIQKPPLVPSAEGARKTESIPICSPLRDIPLEGLKETISNPFNPPPVGSDDPHQGVDFAIEQDGIALAGEKVQAVFSGRVAAIILDRFPYGNAVLLESRLEDLPTRLQSQLLQQPLRDTVITSSALSCPNVEGYQYLDDQPDALYLLYAHLDAMEIFKVGQALACGQGLGKVGQSGNALNPHLHLEARIGPAASRFDSLAHYVTNASTIEMHNYCLWRVSGKFRLLDPLILFDG